MSALELVTAKDLGRSFADEEGNTTDVVAGLSFSLTAGTITALLGASGCGKTTLLRMVAGLDRPDRGAIISELDLPGPKLGYVQQGERLLPWRSLLDNVGLALELSGCSKREAQIAARKALTDVGLSDYASWYPDQISGGMTQRVLLARAFITQPSILLLDEPFGQLDIIARKDLAAILRGYISTHGAAALLVTHSVEEAVFISDTIVTLTRRPARVHGHFTLTTAAPQNGSVALSAESSYDTVQRSLLEAIDVRRAV